MVVLGHAEITSVQPYTATYGSNFLLKMPQIADVDQDVGVVYVKIGKTTFHIVSTFSFSDKGMYPCHPAPVP